MDRVLIVDDDASILRVLRMRLESENYTVSAASCSEEAQERMTEETFDLAIVDLKLGEDCGIELMKRLHRTVPKLPVIILTAYGSIESAMKAMRNGAYCYLTKSFDNRELLVQVRNGIEKSKLSNEDRQLQSMVRN
jgi:DNA-binding NtrC family response regulator